LAALRVPFARGRGTRNCSVHETFADVDPRR
jgi:hypothetical protein